MFWKKEYLIVNLTVLQAIGGVGYYLFIFMNKDDDERGGGGPSDGNDTDLTLEEARRIMEKYK